MDLGPEVIQSYSDEFELICQTRHMDGEAKYGAVKFVTSDTLQEAIEEVADLGNYARYTFIKLRALQDKLVELGVEAKRAGA